MTDIRDTNGNTVYRMSGSEIKDTNGSTVYRISGSEIRDTNGSTVYRIRDNEIKDTNGSTVYRIRDNEIKDANGNTVYRIPADSGSAASSYSSSHISSGEDTEGFATFLFIAGGIIKLAWRIATSFVFFLFKAFGSLGGKIGGALGLVLGIIGIVASLIEGGSSIESAIFMLVLGSVFYGIIGYVLENIIIFIRALFTKNKN